MASTIPTTSFDEEEVRILLLGSSLEINRGLTLIDREFRRPLMGWIRQRFPGIQSADLATIWGDMLSSLFKMIQQGRFDAGRPLVPLLTTLLKRRATDHTRRAEAEDRLIQVIADRLRDTQTGLAWKMYDETDRRQIKEAIRDSIQPLPPKQKIVMELYVDHYPDTESMEFLRRVVSRATGQEETIAAVKRALQEARGKVREWLRDRGYDDLAN